MSSTLLEGCSAPVMPVTTMTAIMMRSTVAMITIQRFSVRATTSSGTMPSGSGRLSGFLGCSANGASRQEHKEIKRQPTEEQQPDGDAGNEVRTDWPVTQRLRRLFRVDRRAGVRH